METEEICNLKNLHNRKNRKKQWMILIGIILIVILLIWLVWHRGQEDKKYTQQIMDSQVRGDSLIFDILLQNQKYMLQILSGHSSLSKSDSLKLYWLEQGSQQNILEQKKLIKK